MACLCTWPQPASIYSDQPLYRRSLSILIHTKPLVAPSWEAFPLVLNATLLGVLLLTSMAAEETW